MLVEAIGEYAMMHLDERKFRSISAYLHSETNEVRFFIDLYSDTERNQRQVIDVLFDNVQPMFLKDGVEFTVVFAHSQMARSKTGLPPVFATA